MPDRPDLRPAALLLALLLPPAAPLAAQATGDQSRLVFTVSGGYAFGHDLWQVDAQPVIQDGLTDVLALERRLTGTWTAGLGATFFRNANLGFTFDALLVDLRQRDTCRQLTNSGSTKNPQICASIDGVTNSSMSAYLSGGVILRAASRAKVSPFVRVQGGGFFGSLNSTELVGSYETETGEPSFVFIYPEGDNSTFTPQFAFGAGVTVPVARAYHLRFEGRATTFGLKVIDGATLSQDVPPRTSTRYLTQFTLHAGIDLVLERRRGRRY